MVVGLVPHKDIAHSHALEASGMPVARVCQHSISTSSQRFARWPRNAPLLRGRTSACHATSPTLSPLAPVRTYAPHASTHAHALNHPALGQTCHHKLRQRRRVVQVVRLAHTQQAAPSVGLARSLPSVDTVCYAPAQVRTALTGMHVLQILSTHTVKMYREERRHLVHITGRSFRCSMFADDFRGQRSLRHGQLCRHARRSPWLLLRSCAELPTVGRLSQALAPSGRFPRRLLLRCPEKHGTREMHSVAVETRHQA
jgi:hypothetical protein